MSRRARPKQLLPFIDGRSLLQLADARLDGLIPRERRLICTGESHRAAVREALPALTDEQILGEPLGRDTVNAVGYTAAALQQRDLNAVFAVLTSDHLIEPEDEFRAKLDLGFRLVEDDPTRFVTFSITPTFPATGYGYVERGEAIAARDFAGAFRAKRFIEKPDAKTAKSYLDAGTFGWNSGMFVFSAGAFMEALAKFKPESHAGLTKVANAWNTPDRPKILNEVYPTLPKISVDYAIMEPASRDDHFTVCTVPMNVSWMDVGSWTSYAATLEPDVRGHRTNARAVHLDSNNVLAVSDDPTHMIATIGCENLIVIHTADATLIVPAALAERVKEMAAKVDPSLQ